MDSIFKINSVLIISLIFITICDQIICENDEYEDSSISMHKIEMPVDHFNVNNGEKWNMTYMENKKFCTPNGPILILAVPGRHLLLRGQFYNLAEANNGCLFSIFIRFSEDLIPTKNLELLNVDQNLEDMAYFVEQIKIINPDLKDSKVIFGGSGVFGSFVVWFKHKYPNMIDAGWVSDAPIEAKLDDPDMINAIADHIRNVGGEQCYAKVSEGLNQLSNLFENNKDEVVVKQSSKICLKIDENSKNDISSLFEIVAFHWLVRTFMDETTDSCSEILNAESSLEGVMNDLSKSEQFPQNSCWNKTFKDLVSDLSKTDYLNIFHHMCNEFGWWPISATRDQLFGKHLPLSYYVNLCAALYGEKYTEGYMRGKIDEFNKKYGGRNPKNVENIFFMQSNLNVYRSFTHKKAIRYPDVMPGDVFDESIPNESQTLKDAKKRISESITNIINVDYSVILIN